MGQRATKGALSHLLAARGACLDVAEAGHLAALPPRALLEAEAFVAQP